MAGKTGKGRTSKNGARGRVAKTARAKRTTTKSATAPRSAAKTSVSRLVNPASALSAGGVDLLRGWSPSRYSS